MKKTAHIAIIGIIGIGIFVAAAFYVFQINSNRIGAATISKTSSKELREESQKNKEVLLKALEVQEASLSNSYTTLKAARDEALKYANTCAMGPPGCPTLNEAYQTAETNFRLAEKRLNNIKTSIETLKSGDGAAIAFEGLRQATLEELQKEEQRAQLLIDDYKQKLAAYNTCLNTPSKDFTQCINSNGLREIIDITYKSSGSLFNPLDWVSEIGRYISEGDAVKAFINERIKKQQEYLSSIQNLSKQAATAAPGTNLAAIIAQSQSYVGNIVRVQAGGEDKGGVTDNSARAGDELCFSGKGYAGGFNLYVCTRYVVATFAYMFLTLAGWLVGISGLFFDEVLRYTVIEMRGYMNKGLGDAITTSWAMFRDLGNIAFIFILLGIALRTIFDINSDYTKRLIRNVIIIGLLVNFSLFFTKFVIDISNVLSINFYNGIAGTGVDFSSFSGRFTAPLGLQSLYGGSGTTFVQRVGGNYTQIFVIGIGGSVFLLITAFTFLYAGLLFILRFVALIFLMILSPLAFFAFILPATEGFWKKWKDALLSQLIFAPLYMLLIYAAYLLTTRLDLMTGAGLKTVTGERIGLLNALAVNPQEITKKYNVMGGVVQFALIIAFMNAASYFATQQAAKGGKMIGRAVSTINKYANPRALTTKTIRATAGRATGAATFGLGAKMYRGSIGKRATVRLEQEGEDLKKRSAEGDLRAKKTLEKLQARSTSSGDLRNTKLGGTVSSKLGLGTAGGKGGYKARYEAQEAKMTDKILRKGDRPTRATLKKIDAAQGNLDKENEVYRKLAAQPIPTDPTAKKNHEEALKNQNNKIKSAESQLKFQKQNAATEISDQRRRFAAEMAKPRLWRNSFVTTGKVEAAQKFLEKVRTRKSTPEESVAELANEIRVNIESNNRAKIAELLKKAKAKIVKDLPDDILENTAVARVLNVDQLEEIRKKGELSQSAKEKIYTELLARTTVHPGFALTSENQKLATYMTGSGSRNAAYWST